MTRRLQESTTVSAAARLPPNPRNISGILNARKPAAKRNRKNVMGTGGTAGQGAGGGSMHHRDEELHDLMDIMEEIIPIGKYEKERV
jgi:hypothetical protein